VRGAEVLEGGGARSAEPLDDRVQHVDGGPGVGERAMVRGDARPDMTGEGGEPVVADLVAAEHRARAGEGVQLPGPGPGDAAGRGLRAEAADVEAGVVRHQD